jgi:hypothetical protein
VKRKTKVKSKPRRRAVKPKRRFAGEPFEVWDYLVRDHVKRYGSSARSVAKLRARFDAELLPLIEELLERALQEHQARANRVRNRARGMRVASLVGAIGSFEESTTWCNEFHDDLRALPVELQSEIGRELRRRIANNESLIKHVRRHLTRENAIPKRDPKRQPPKDGVNGDMLTAQKRYVELLARFQS